MELNLFNLIKEEGAYKLEITLEPLKRNIIKEISEKEYNKLSFKYFYFKREENEGITSYRERIDDLSNLHKALSIEYHKDFRDYYLGAI